MDDDTFAALTRFHREVVMPDVSKELTRFHREVAMPEAFSMLTRFHREVAMPEMRDLVGSAVGGLRDEMNGHFDEIYRRLDRLDIEYQAIVAGLRRIEERLECLETNVDAIDGRLGRTERTLDGAHAGLEVLADVPKRAALRSELVELKARIALLEEQVQQLEGRLSA